MRTHTIYILVFRPLILFLFIALCMALNRVAPGSLPKGTIKSVRQSEKKMTRAADSVFLRSLLEKYPQYFGSLLADPGAYRIQIIYTRIDRKAGNKPFFTDHEFQVDPEHYFYPASTVKMPTALLALQRLRELNIAGLDRNSPMITGAAYSGQNEVLNDPTAPEGKPSVGHYVKKIFLVSDNDAFNRLYEFLGPEYINNNLHRMGYKKAAIIHRLERALTEEENRHTNPVQFLGEKGKILYEQPLRSYTAPYAGRSEKLGIGYMKGDQLMNGPMDFSKKNRLVLQDLHEILKSILFPEAVPANKRFNISPDDYRFVLKYMSQYPPETHSPAYDSVNYWDAYCKFIYWGADKAPLPKSFRIFNKVGDAYGFLIDAAYVVDFERKVEFMVSACIYCNADGILNDSKYDYDSVGFPFLKNLGRVLYDHELKRKRQYLPDLSAFRFAYEK